MRNEPFATIITEALEGYASGRLQTQAEVKRFLEQHDILYKNIHGEIPQQRVVEIITRPIYAGYISHENWGLKLFEGKHEGLISLETYQIIQKRRTSVANAPTRKNIHEDFPLRGFITCGCCGKPLTAGWSKGRSAKYPYYLCQTKGCTEYRKSIRREKIEGEFEVLLKEMRPSEELFVMAFNMFRDLWDSKLASTKQQTTSMKKERAQIERKVSLFLERIVDASSTTIIRTYEDKITELEENKLVLNERIKNCGRPAASFDETYRTAFQFLGNPHKLWGF